MHAYRGTTIAGFPNLFFLLGPNTGLGHTSVVLMIEAQLHLVLAALRHMRATGIQAIEPTARAQRRWTERVDQKMAGTVWQTGCSSWYLDATGRNTTIWPGFATGFRMRLRRFRPADYRSRRPAAPQRTGAGARRCGMTWRARSCSSPARRAASARRWPAQAAARGARVALVGLEGELLEAARADLDAHWHECDVTDQAALDAAVASTVDRFGGIDVVVANAGIANLGTVAVGPVDALVRTVEVNLCGAIRTVSAALPHVTAARGHVLLVSSAAAFTAMPGMAAYCASKAGVEQFANVLRLETRSRGVTVGTAHPIWIDTDLVRDIRDDLASFRTALRRLPWPLSTVVPSSSASRPCSTASSAASARCTCHGRSPWCRRCGRWC